MGMGMDSQVLKTETCRYSGLKIYPGHGLKYIRGDSQTFLFLNAKCKRLYNLRKKPSKLAWTFQYRKAHKKDSKESTRTKKRKVASKAVARSIVGASLEVIQKKRAEKPEQRQAARDAALRYVCLITDTNEREREREGACVYYVLRAYIYICTSVIC